MGDVSGTLLSWFNLVKKNLDTKEKWTEIPNVGIFENLDFVIEDADLDENEIVVRIKYDNWKEPESGKFIRELNELVKTNFNLKTWLVDDPEHDYYSKFPQLIINWDNNLSNHTSRISIDKGESETVWVNVHPSETFVCKTDVEEVLWCLFGILKRKQKEHGIELEKMPCEQNKKPE